MRDAVLSNALCMRLDFSAYVLVIPKCTDLIFLPLVNDCSLSPYPRFLLGLQKKAGERKQKSPVRMIPMRLRSPVGKSQTRRSLRLAPQTYAIFFARLT
jgi:hypothetical protein